MTRKFLITVALLFGAGVFALALYGAAGNKLADGDAAVLGGGVASGEHMAVLSGFEPGAAVTYSVLSGAGSDAGGTAIVDEYGQVEISRSGVDKLREESALTYNIRVDQSQRPVNVNLTMASDTGALSVSGSGAGDFSEVLIETTQGGAVIGQNKTKADWTGFFNQDSLPLPAGPASTKLVLYDGIESDADLNKPLTIEVYQAIGGGLKTNAQVNEYNNLHCEDDPTELSVCDEDKLDEQNEMIVDHYVIALASMTEQFSAIMMQQVAIIGTFLDAKMQMETQRELQMLNAEAVKDYHPDEQMCQFGTFVRSVAKTEELAAANKVGLSNILTNTYVDHENSSTAEGYDMDMQARIRQYRVTYCDPKDNNDGLAYMCDHDQDGNLSTGSIGAHYFNDGPPKRARGGDYVPVVAAGSQTNNNGEEYEIAANRMNKDIDYLRTVDYPLTLNVNFEDDVRSRDEEDAIALARNLYWPRALAPTASAQAAKKHGVTYMKGRQVAAIHNVAHNSFTEIVALKSASVAEEDSKTGPAFMKALMADLGVDDLMMDELMGEFPSYYAQMEVLTKKMYQNPDFYTNLYTKPANIDRISASMDAIELMQLRDHYDAALRREMLTSLMVEEALTKYFNIADDRIRSESRKF